MLFFIRQPRSNVRSARGALEYGFD